MDNSFLNGFETEVLMLLDGSYGVWVQILSWFHLLVFQPVMIVVFAYAIYRAGVYRYVTKTFMWTVRIVSLPLVAVFAVIWGIIANLEHINYKLNYKKTTKNK